MNSEIREIINDNILRVKIDLILDDLYYQELELEKEIREVSFDNNIDNVEKKIEKVEIKSEEENDKQDLFKEINDDKAYSIYHVYVFSDNDTLENILSKYKVTKEELEEINDLSNLKPGVKIIIPSTNE